MVANAGISHPFGPFEVHTYIHIRAARSSNGRVLEGLNDAEKL